MSKPRKHFHLTHKISSITRLKKRCLPEYLSHFRRLHLSLVWLTVMTRRAHDAVIWSGRGNSSAKRLRTGYKCKRVKTSSWVSIKFLPRLFPQGSCRFRGGSAVPRSPPHRPPPLNPTTVTTNEHNLVNYLPKSGYAIQVRSRHVFTFAYVHCAILLN